MNQDTELNFNADMAKKLTENYKTTIIREIMDKIKSACLNGNSHITAKCLNKYADDVLKHLTDLDYHCSYCVYEQETTIHISWVE